MSSGVAALIAFAIPVSGETLNPSSLIVFGDSLSDTGNDYIGTGGYEPGPPTNYTAGRFTDGATTTPSTTGPFGNWVDQFAPKIGLASPSASLAGGTNFAFGGSQTLQNTTIGPFAIPSLNTEVTLALAANFGSMPSNALYSFWSGANDILDNPTNPGVGVASADDIFNQILKVAAAGGKNFLWFNLPPLGDTPRAGAAASEASTAAAAFDAQWAVDIQKLIGDGINVIPVNMNSLFVKVAADYASGCVVGPSDPYCFANVTSPAQGTSANPNTYLFWDAEHPTTAADALIADAAFDALQSGSAAVPEPASLALVGGGLFVLALSLRRRRANQLLRN